MRSIKFLGQKGMTLPEIMIGAALMGGVALITAKLMGDQANNQAYISAKADVSSVVTKIESFLNNPEQCTLMLKDKFVSAYPGTSVGAGGLNFTTPPPGLELINVIRETSYKSFDILAGGIRLQNSVYGANVTDVVISFTMKGKSFTYGPSSSQKVITKKISIVTQLDATFKVEACGPVLGESVAIGQQKLCDTMGGAASWVGGRCVLNDVKCPWGQVATKMINIGGIACTPLSTQVKLDEIFDLSSKNCTGMNTIKIINSGSKLKVDCI